MLNKCYQEGYNEAPVFASYEESVRTLCNNIRQTCNKFAASKFQSYSAPSRVFA